MKLVYCNKCFKSFEITRKVMQDQHGQRIICDTFDTSLVLNHQCDEAASKLKPAKPLDPPEPVVQTDELKSFPKPAMAQPQGITDLIESMKNKGD